MPQIEGMTRATLRKFLTDMRIVGVQFNAKDPEAIELYIGEERGPITGILIVSALDDGVLHVKVMGTEEEAKLGLPDRFRPPEFDVLDEHVANWNAEVESGGLES